MDTQSIRWVAIRTSAGQWTTVDLSAKALSQSALSSSASTVLLGRPPHGSTFLRSGLRVIVRRVLVFALHQIGPSTLRWLILFRLLSESMSYSPICLTTSIQWNTYLSLEVSAW